jgi:GT2 family glycosyltransferase
VTVVVLTFNRRLEVLRTLGSLRHLAGRPAIVVVDNGSTDRTTDAIRHNFPDACLVSLPHNAGAAGRNIGASYVRTPYVAFSDDDTRWEYNALTRAADILDQYPALAVVSAHVLVGAEGREDPACEPMRHSPLDADGLPGSRILGFMAGACVFRLSAFRAAGGYLPRLFIGGEEALLSLDLAVLGWRMAYCPEVVTHHHPSPVRDSRSRRRLLARNAIWTAWMRLPFIDALRETRRALAAMVRQRQFLSGCREAFAGMSMVMAERRVVPVHVCRMWRATHRRQHV